MAEVVLNGWRVSCDTETFRIFPKNSEGEVCPVTRVNMRLYLRHTRTGDLIVFKRYLHMRKWYYRDSRDCPKRPPMYEQDLVGEIARLLFPVAGSRDGDGVPAGDRARAGDLLVAWIFGRPLA